MEIRDFDRQFLFHSYLLNLSSNFTKMVTFESYKLGLSDCERMFTVHYIMNALKHSKVRLPFYTPCIAKIYLFSFVETPRKIIAELSVRKLASSSMLINYLFIYLSSSAIINLRSVSTKLNNYYYQGCKFMFRYTLYPHNK